MKSDNYKVLYKEQLDEKRYMAQWMNILKTGQSVTSLESPDKRPAIRNIKNKLIDKKEKATASTKLPPIHMRQGKNYLMQAIANKILSMRKDELAKKQK